MAAKIVLITGANHGIGYETAKAFLQSQNPYHILLGTRSLQKGDEALQNLRAECPNVMNAIELLQIDVASDESITRAFEVPRGFSLLRRVKEMLMLERLSTRSASSHGSGLFRSLAICSKYYGIELHRNDSIVTT